MNLVGIPVVPKKYCGFVRTNLQTGGAIAPIELALDTGKANLDFDILHILLEKLRLPYSIFVKHKIIETP